MKLIEAKELTNKDIIGKSDPFAELFIRPLRDKIKTSKTIVRILALFVRLIFKFSSYSKNCRHILLQNNQTNPIWNEHFEFVVEDVSTQHLTIRVFDDEGIQASELIGCAQVPLSELEPGKVKDLWLKLVKDLEIQRDQKNRGQVISYSNLYSHDFYDYSYSTKKVFSKDFLTILVILKVHLELLYCPLNAGSEFYNPFDADFRLTTVEKAFKHVIDTDPLKSASDRKKDVIIRGVLSVTVISAENLPATDLMGKSDPYVVITTKKSEQKNKTRVRSLTIVLLYYKKLNPLAFVSKRLNVFLKPSGP